MHAMNASSLHLWLGFHSFLKCYSLKTAKGLDLYSPVRSKASQLPDSVCLVWGQIRRTQSCTCVIIQTLWSWHSLLTNVVLVELYLTSLPGLYSSTGSVIPGLLLGLMPGTSLCILLQDSASGLHRMRGNAVHTLVFPPPTPITSLHT